MVPVMRTVKQKPCKLLSMITKINLFPLIIAVTGLISCKTTQLKHSTATETGMFKVAILYPNGEDKTFDMDYYEKKHMPMVAGFLGKNLKFYEIDKGLAGRAPNEKVPFVAIGYLPFFVSSSRNGNPNCLSSSRPSSGFFAVVTIVMFIPCWNVTVAASTSGKTVCSVNPKL